MTPASEPMDAKAVIVEAVTHLRQRFRDFHDLQRIADSLTALAEQVGAMEGENKRLKEENASLESECEPFRPMSIEEVEEALKDIEPEPLSESQILHGLKYATDDGYRAECNHKKYVRQFQITRGLKAELDRLKAISPAPPSQSAVKHAGRDGEE